MRTNAVNVVFFLLALALGLAMAQLPVSLVGNAQNWQRLFWLLAAGWLSLSVAANDDASVCFFLRENVFLFPPRGGAL